MRSSAPVLVVAPAVVPEAELLACFAAGADACLSRPGRHRELVARTRAIVRRSPPRARDEAPAAELRVGPYALDVAAGVLAVNGMAVPLAEPEVIVLRALMARPGRVVPRSDLAQAGELLRGGGLDGVVRRLRAKLEGLDGVRRIVAVRAVGFRFETPDR